MPECHRARILAQLQPHARIASDVADVACVQAMFRHYPELVADAPVAYRRAARLSALATDGLEQRIPGWYKARREEELDWRVEQVFLKRVDDPMFHVPTR